jgi:hypothetical protein
LAKSKVVFFQPFPKFEVLPRSGNLCVTGRLSAGVEWGSGGAAAGGVDAVPERGPWLPPVGKGEYRAVHPVPAAFGVGMLVGSAPPAQISSVRSSTSSRRLRLRFPFAYFCVTLIEMRRFVARPSSVELSATGCCAPYPSATIRSLEIPIRFSSCLTLSARACDSF